MDSSLSSKLEALRQYQQPVSNLKLLRILAPFLYQLSFPAANSSLRVQTIHYIMENYYEKQVKSDSINSSSVITGLGYCCCFSCGNLLGSDWVGITLSCGKCQKEDSLSYYFLADLLSHCYQIPHRVTAYIISDYLGKRYERTH
jgi:hypothetical protein